MTGPPRRPGWWLSLARRRQDLDGREHPEVQGDLETVVGLLLRETAATIASRTVLDDPDGECRADLVRARLAEPAALGGLHHRLFIVARRAEARGDLPWSTALGVMAALCLSLSHAGSTADTQSRRACAHAALELAEFVASPDTALRLRLIGRGLDVDQAARAARAAVQ